MLQISRHLYVIRSIDIRDGYLYRSQYSGALIDFNFRDKNARCRTKWKTLDNTIHERIIFTPTDVYVNTATTTKWISKIEKGNFVSRDRVFRVIAPDRYANRVYSINLLNKDWPNLQICTIEKSFISTYILPYYINMYVYRKWFVYCVPNNFFISKSIGYTIFWSIIIR